MAVINFVKGEQYYTAEFQINGPVNVHIERAEAGALYFRQRSIDHGSYDLINGANWNNRGDLTIDTAIQGVVYPMWIKIESASEPTLAEMVEGEQSGGGAGESTITYYDVSGLDKTNMYVSMALKAAVSAKFTTGYGNMVAPYAYATLIGSDLPTLINNTLAIAIDTAIIINDGRQEAQNSRDVFIGILETDGIAMPPIITKEQFYNLEA